MSLCLVATPIGHPLDLSQRAINYLKSCDVIIGEEERELRRLLKFVNISDKTTELLNEHSTPIDLKRLVSIIREKEVALVSDCGTPAFCDPGANLVNCCYAEGIKVTTIPGPNSVISALSLSGFEFREFVFKGFLSQKTPERIAEIKEISREHRALILMDTPYRLEKLVSELSQEMPSRDVFLAANTTQKDEWSFRGQLRKLLPLVVGKKAEFVLVLGPKSK